MRLGRQEWGQIRISPLAVDGEPRWLTKFESDPIPVLAWSANGVRLELRSAARDFFGDSTAQFESDPIRARDLMRREESGRVGRNGVRFEFRRSPLMVSRGGLRNSSLTSFRRWPGRRMGSDSNCDRQLGTSSAIRPRNSNLTPFSPRRGEDLRQDRARSGGKPQSASIGTPGRFLAVRNTIIDFTCLTFGAEVSREVRNF